MYAAVAGYFRELTEAFGHGWNRFWYEPRSPRVISLMRVPVGLISLYTLLCYTPDLITFFGRDGLTPASTMVAISYNDPMAGGKIQLTHGRYLQAMNYLAWLENEPDGMLWAAHAAGIAIVAAFALGLKTRFTSILALIVMLTYFHRAPVLCSQLEPILSFVLAYLCLGPCGAHYSLDRWLKLRRGGRAASEPPLSIAANVSTRLLQVHLSLVYVMMAFGKLARPALAESIDVWWSGEAVWWLIAKPGASLVDLTWLHAHPFLVDAWTQAIVFFELGFGILVWNRLARPLMLVVAVPMWLSLAVLTGLTPYCLAMLTANLCFVSPDLLRGKQTGSAA